MRKDRTQTRRERTARTKGSYDSSCPPRAPGPPPPRNLPGAHHIFSGQACAASKGERAARRRSRTADRKRTVHDRSRARKLTGWSAARLPPARGGSPARPTGFEVLPRRDSALHGAKKRRTPQGCIDPRPPLQGVPRVKAAAGGPVGGGEQGGGGVEKSVDAPGPPRRWEVQPSGSRLPLCYGGGKTGSGRG